MACKRQPFASQNTAYWELADYQCNSSRRKDACRMRHISNADGRGRSLLYEYQLRRVVATPAQVVEKRVEQRLRQGLRAAHYPKILVRTAAHKHIAVVGRNVENVIVGIEPQEERHLELARLRSVGQLPLPRAVLCLPSLTPSLTTLMRPLPSRLYVAVTWLMPRSNLWS